MELNIWFRKSGFFLVCNFHVVRDFVMEYSQTKHSGVYMDTRGTSMMTQKITHSGNSKLFFPCERDKDN